MGSGAPFVLGCCCLFIAIVFVVVFARELKFHEQELGAECTDVVVNSIDSDNRRRRGSAQWTYDCVIGVTAITKDDADTLTDKSRKIAEIHTAEGEIDSLGDLFTGGIDQDAEIAQATTVCNGRFRNRYNCFVLEDEEEIREEQTGYPILILLIMILAWLCYCASCAALFISENGLDSSFPSSGGVDPAPVDRRLQETPLVVKGSLKPAQVSPSEERTSRPSQERASRPSQETPLVVKPSQVGGSNNFDVPQPPSEEPAELPEPTSSFRRLVREDLCDQLIPGLSLRVLSSTLRGKRWCAARAISYDLSAATVTVRFIDKTLMAKAKDSKGTFSIDSGQVRLHEDALSQIAKSRIMGGLIQTSLFNGATFASLDSDGNGFLERGELSTGLNKLGIELDRPTLNALVHRLDTNKDGKVNATEFQRFLGLAESRPGRPSKW